jgi:hypothetical protein
MFQPASSITRKVFVSYHSQGDQAYYDAYPKAFCDTYDVITDNSFEREVDPIYSFHVFGALRNQHLRCGRLRLRPKGTRSNWRTTSDGTDFGREQGHRFSAIVRLHTNRLCGMDELA